MLLLKAFCMWLVNELYKEICKVILAKSFIFYFGRAIADYWILMCSYQNETILKIFETKNYKEKNNSQKKSECYDGNM